jgi:hypothetical protein
MVARRALGSVLSSNQGGSTMKVFGHPRNLGAALALGLALIAAGCGVQPGTSRTEYKPLDRSYEGVLRKIEHPTITICLKGLDASDQWATWTRESVLKWIAPLRERSAVPLADTVTFATAGAACTSADAEVNLYAQNFRAYTQIGSRPAIFVSRQDARDGHVIFHELGHAFGMGDTYGLPDSGSQPDSVMKTARFDTLQDDDLRGIRYLYDRMKGVAVADAAADRAPYVTVVPE